MKNRGCIAALNVLQTPSAPNKGEAQTRKVIGQADRFFGDPSYRQSENNDTIKNFLSGAPALRGRFPKPPNGNNKAKNLLGEAPSQLPSFLRRGHFFFNRLHSNPYQHILSPVMVQGMGSDDIKPRPKKSLLTALPSYNAGSLVSKADRPLIKKNTPLTPTLTPAHARV